MANILVCSPPGTDVSGAIEKLKQCIGPDVTAEIDIEKVLCDLVQAKDALRQAGIHSDQPSMLDITWNLSRFTVTELWELAAKQAIHEINRLTPKTKIICCNLVYYGGRRDEFYSAVKSEILFGEKNGWPKPSHIVILIDDVYDMYLRLTGSGEIFDFKPWTGDYLRKVETEEGTRIKAIGSQRLVGYLLASQLAIMTRLLWWRNVEEILAENLALQCKAKFMVWGVKQMSKVVASWLGDENLVSVYLSHPISRPRQQLRRERSWPEVVRQFNSLQQSLFEEGLECVMPTAIDELRVARDKGRRLPRLEERWPLPTEDQEEILYCCPESGGDIHHTGLLSPKGWDFTKQEVIPAGTIAKGSSVRGQLDTLLRDFERDIGAQTSARDHLLVSHTKGMLVFRPFISKGEFSSGVEAEIAHWISLAKSDAAKRVAFIHFDEDVKDWLEVQRKEIGANITRWMAKVVANEFGLSIDKATEVIQWIQVRKAAMLDKGPVPRMREITSQMPHIKEEAKKKLLREHLTGGATERGPQAGLWIARNMAELEASYHEIARFLSVGEAPSDSWYTRIDNLLPDTVR